MNIAISGELTADVEDACAMFKLSMGAKFAPYDSENNFRTMMNWIVENCGGVQACATVGAYQLAFANCLPSLTRDDNHPVLIRQRNAERQVFRDRVNRMSVAELKSACANEAGFREKYDALVKSEDEIANWRSL